MQAFGPASESLRLAERYRSLTDDELLAIAEDSSDLTDLAQQALIAEMSQRKLSIPPKVAAPPAALEPSSDTDVEDPYAEDRKLVQVATVFSLRDAVQLQKLLDDAGIPCFIGEEQAARADAVTSNFSSGVPVAVMEIGVAWAQQAMQNYQPADDPVTPDQGGEDLAVHCPRCHSEDVIFEQLADQSDSSGGQKFDWTCASCGYRWEDEGVETKN